MFLSLNSVILSLTIMVLFSNTHNAMINISILMLTSLFYSATDLSNGKYSVYTKKEVSKISCISLTISQL